MQGDRMRVLPTFPDAIRGAQPRVSSERSERKMIDFKTAVKKALEFLAGVYANENLLDVRLEEIELSEGDDFWNITLSYAKFIRPSSLEEELSDETYREYKVIAVRSADGEVRSMKIRQLV